MIRTFSMDRRRWCRDGLFPSSRGKSTYVFTRTRRLAPISKGFSKGPSKGGPAARYRPTARLPDDDPLRASASPREIEPLDEIEAEGDTDEAGLDDTDAVPEEAGA